MTAPLAEKKAVLPAPADDELRLVSTPVEVDTECLGYRVPPADPQVGKHYDGLPVVLERPFLDGAGMVLGRVRFCHGNRVAQADGGLAVALSSREGLMVVGG